MVRGHEAAGNAPLAARGRARLRFTGPTGVLWVSWPSEIGSTALRVDRFSVRSGRNRLSGVFRPEPVADDDLLVSPLSRDYRPRSSSSRRSLSSCGPQPRLGPPWTPLLSGRPSVPSGSAGTHHHPGNGTADRRCPSTGPDPAPHCGPRSGRRARGAISSGLYSQSTSLSPARAET